MYKISNKNKSTFVSKCSDSRAVKLFVSSLVMLFVLLFPSMQYAFAQEVAHKKIAESPTKVKQEEVEIKTALTVLVARKQMPTLQTKAKQKTRSKLNNLEDKSTLPVKAKSLSI
ncbi:hypothetical protein AADZ86_11035 [Colwelliaceae bacterium BS250]